MRLLLLLTVPSFAQIRKIPAEVTQAFKDKYPNADNVSWKDKLTAFEAAIFESEAMKNMRHDSLIKANGKAQKRKLKKANLPSEIKDGFGKSKYADWELKNIYFIQLPEDATQYRILVAKSDIQKKNLLFNSDGKLLKDNLTLK